MARSMEGGKRYSEESVPHHGVNKSVQSSASKYAYQIIINMKMTK